MTDEDEVEEAVPPRKRARALPGRRPLGRPPPRRLPVHTRCRALLCSLNPRITERLCIACQQGDHAAVHVAAQHCGGGTLHQGVF